MTMSPDYATRTLKQILELQAQGATWADIAHVMKIQGGPKIAKKLAKDCARVSQRTLAEQGIGFS